MTHEHHAGDEPEGGPQHDGRLPDADTIPVADGPFDLPAIDQLEEWDEDEMSPGYASELAAAVVLGIPPAEEA